MKSPQITTNRLINVSVPQDFDAEYCRKEGERDDTEMETAGSEAKLLRLEGCIPHVHHIRRKAAIYYIPYLPLFCVLYQLAILVYGMPHTLHTLFWHSVSVCQLPKLFGDF